MKELLTAALEDAKRRLVENDDCTTVKSGHFTPNYHRGENEVESQLRLDIEFPSPVVKNITRKELMDLIFDYLYPDMEDLIENGDVEQYRDPILQVFDGAKKRNQRPVFIDITGIGLYPEYSYGKDTYEYTIYMRLYIRWE